MRYEKSVRREIWTVITFVYGNMQLVASWTPRKIKIALEYIYIDIIRDSVVRNSYL